MNNVIIALLVILAVAAFAICMYACVVLARSEASMFLSAVYAVGS